MLKQIDLGMQISISESAASFIITMVIHFARVDLLFLFSHIACQTLKLEEYYFRIFFKGCKCFHGSLIIGQYNFS